MDYFYKRYTIAAGLRKYISLGLRELLRDISGLTAVESKEGLLITYDAGDRSCSLLVRYGFYGLTLYSGETGIISGYTYMNVGEQKRMILSCNHLLCVFILNKGLINLLRALKLELSI